MKSNPVRLQTVTFLLYLIACFVKLLGVPVRFCILRTLTIDPLELPRGFYVKCVRNITVASRSNGVSYGGEEMLEGNSAYNSYCKPTCVERITTVQHNISCTHTNPLLAVALPRVMVEI